MHNGIGRTADGHAGGDGIVKGLSGQNIPRFQVLPGHLDNAAAHRRGHAGMLGEHGGNGRGTGQGHTQGFSNGPHGRGRAHSHAVTGRPGNTVFDLRPGFVVQVAGTTLSPVFPSVATTAQRLFAPTRNQHRAAR